MLRVIVDQGTNQSSEVKQIRQIAINRSDLTIFFCYTSKSYQGSLKCFEFLLLMSNFELRLSFGWFEM